MSRPITYDDIAIMQQYYDADQHSMVYQYYHTVTGSWEAWTQSQISDPNSFSGLGGVAMRANLFAQLDIEQNLGDGYYPPYGLHSFSREIAQNFIDTVRGNVDAGGDGILSGSQMLRAAQGVWDQHGIGAYFPGNFLEGNILTPGAWQGLQAFGSATVPSIDQGPTATVTDPAYYYGGALNFLQPGNIFTNPANPFASSFMPPGWDDLSF